MKKRLTIAALLVGALFFGFLAFSATSPLGASASTPRRLATGVLSAQRLPGMLASVAGDANIRSDVKGAKVAGQKCIAVSHDGRTVVDESANSALIPASTLKLLTATAALNLYGPQGVFTTTVKSTNNNNGVVNGPLYLVGGGDPLLFTAEYAKALNRKDEQHTSLEALADQVKAKGVRVIHGSVIGDDSRFDQTRYLSSWDPGYQAQGQIGPTGALQVNQGFERFTGGRVPAPSPTLHAVAAFTELLKQRGITIDGQPASGIAPEKANELSSINSQPVSAIVREMLTESDNSTAEMMLRNVGVKASNQGSFNAGVAAIKAQAAKSGIPMQGVVMVDGSGLDRSDKATCSTLIGALVHDGPNGVIANGLPKAGQTGTLTDRMNNSPAQGHVVAKTGTLANVSALAGWVTPTGGSPFAFAIINNGVTSDVGRGYEDGLAAAFASAPVSSSPSEYAPSL